MHRLAACALLLLAGLCAPSAAAATDPDASSELTPAQRTQALALSQGVIGRQVGDYAFTDRAGRKVRLSDYRGKPLLVSFIYTGCFQVCPATTKFLAGAVRTAQDGLGPGSFNVVSIGFNLPFDTPEALKEFATKQGVSLPNWEFLSPEAATLPELVRDFGFTYVATGKGFDHLTQVTLLDAEGRIYRQVYGESFATPMLSEPVRELLFNRRSPAPALQDFIEKVRLFCTIYDPASGRYRLDYRLFIEIFTGTTFIGAVLYFLWAGRRRRGPGTP